MSKIIKVILIILLIFMTMPLIGIVFNSFAIEKLENFGFQNEQIQELLQQKDLNISKIKSIDTKEEEETYQEFVSPDGRLKISYPASWLKLEGENLSKFQDKVADRGLNTLFSAQSLDIGKFAQIIVQEGNFDVQQGFEQIIEQMKNVNQEQGWDMETINMEINDEETILEAKYKKIDRYTIHSKEKLVVLETTEENKKIAFIVFIAFDKEWSEFQKQADFIIDSVIIN